MAPSDHSCWYPFLYLIPLSVGWIYWPSLLMNRLCQNKVAKDWDFHLAQTLSFWFFFIRSHKTSCHAVPHGEVRVSREGGQCLITCQQGTEPHQWPQEWAWKYILSQPRLEMTVALAATYTVALGVTQSQRQPAMQRFLTHRNCEITDFLNY